METTAETPTALYTLQRLTSPRPDMSANGEVEGPDDHAPERRGRTISQRPRRQTDHASRPPPTFVRRRLREGTGLVILRYPVTTSLLRVLTRKGSFQVENS